MHNGGEDLESDRRETQGLVKDGVFSGTRRLSMERSVRGRFRFRLQRVGLSPPGAQLFLRTPKAQVLIDAAYGKGRVVVEVPDETSEMSGLAVGSIVFMLSPMASANSDPGRQ